MNFKPTKIKTILAIVIAFIIGGWIFKNNVPIGGRAVLSEQILAGIIAFVIVFVVIYLNYSLLQKKE